MADRLPIFGDSIFQPQQVASRAPGIAATAEIGEEISGAVSSIGKKMQDGESSAMLYQQTNLAGQAKAEYNAQLLSNPSGAMDAYGSYKSKLDTIYNKAPLNPQDRKTLLDQVTNDSNSGLGSALQTNVKQQKLGMQISFNQGFPNALNEISSSFFTNPDLASKQISNLQNTMKTAALNGVITPKDYSTYSKTLGGILDRHTQLMSRMGELDSRGYHTAAAFITQPNDPNSPNAPISATTQSLSDHFNSASNYHDLVAHVQQGTISNGDLVYGMTKLNDSQYDQFLHTLDGVSQAQGAINSGQPYGAIAARYNYLNSTKSDGLTVAEMSERDHLSIFTTNLKNNYVGTITKTPGGQQINQEYLSQVGATESQPFSPDVMQQKLSALSNQYTTKLINYGHALGVPGTMIKPYDSQTVGKFEGTFAPGVDPSQTINSIDTMPKTNAAYLAASMKDPIHGQVILTSSLLSNNDPSNIRPILFKANQSGIDYSPLQFGKDTVTKNDFINRVYSENSAIAQYLTKTGNADQIQPTMQMIANGAKYMAMQNNDTSLDDYKKYISTVSQGVQNAYDIKSGSYYSFNNNQLNLSDGDAQILARYVRNNALESMKKNTNHNSIDASLDINPLQVSMGNDGQLNVTDQQGNNYFSEPYTPSILSAAKQYQKTLDSQSAKMAQRAQKTRVFPSYGYTGQQMSYQTDGGQ